MEALVYEIELRSGADSRVDAVDDYTAEDRRAVFRRGRARSHQSHGVAVAGRQRPGQAQHRASISLAATYADATRALIAGGADLLLIETIFDTLNAKAAAFAVRSVLDELGIDLPIMISGTITDASGRTLSGQTTEAFWNSIRHAQPLIVGLNCALGAAELRPYVEELSRIADTYVSAYPNAGSAERVRRVRADAEPDGAHHRGVREQRLRQRRRWLLRNDARAHPRAARRGGRAPAPATAADPRDACASPVSSRAPSVPTACSSTSASAPTSPARAKFRKLIEADDYNGALDVARQQVANGAQIIDVNMDEGMLDSEAAMARFLQPDCGRAGHRARPDHDRLVEVVGDRGGPQVRCRARASSTRSASRKGEASFIEHARKVRNYGAAVVVMAFDEQGQADTIERKIAICERCYRILTEQVGFPPEDIIFDPNIFAVATGIEEHNGYALGFIEATRLIKERLPARARERRRVSNVSLLVPRQRPGARGDALGVPVPRHPARAWTWGS